VAVRGLSGRVADVGRAIPGAQSLSGVGSTVSGNLLFTADGLLKADAVIQTTGTPEADPWLAALLGAESKAGLRITGRPSQALHFELESLQTALVHGSGECDLGISDAGIEGAFDLRIDGIENLPIEGLEAAGGVLARVAVKGRIDGFSVDATVHPNELRIGEYPVTTGTVRAFVDELPGAASGSVEFDVASGELTLDGRLSGRVDFDGPWRIDDFDVRGLTTRATGRASGRSFEPPYAGRIEARIDDARRWAGLLGIHLIGQGVAEASFSANEGRQQISLEVSATEAEAFLPDLPDFEAVSLSVVAEVEDWSARRISKLDVEGNGLKLGLVRFDTLTLLGEVTGEDATVSVQAAGHYLNDFSVDAEAAVACVECAQRTFRVDSLEAAWEEVPIRLHAPVEVVTEGADFELRGLDASFGEGRLHGGWASAPWPGHGTITAEEIPVELATIVDPAFPFVGRFGGELRADTESKAAAMFDVSLRGLRLADTAGRDLAPVDLDLQGDVETGAIRFSSRMTASTDADVRVEGTIPLIDGRFELDVSDPLRISAHGDVRSGFLGGLFLPPSERIRGALRVDLEAEGTVADPRLHGSVRSDDLGLVSGLTGLKLNGAAFEVLAHGASLELRRFEANDRRGGSVVAQGSASLADGNGVPEYSLRVNLDNLRMVDLDELTVVAGGRLDVSGRGTELRLGGRLTAASADMQLPERLPPDVVLVDVTHVNRREDSKEPGAPGDVPIPVELDLFLDFPGRVTIHAPGLISEWRGDVKVSGTSADPEVDGELRLIRGTIATAGLRFRMKEGRFVIDDDLPVPEIELLGESSRNNVTAIAKIHGPANDPTFELSSDPPLPQDEILSRLLFGTTPGRLTALQSVQLAQAVARFSGLSSGNDPLYQLQRATGIDRVEIKGGEGDEEAAISLGKYLTDRVFLSVDQGLTEQDSTARVEVDLTDNLSAQTEVGQDATTGVGVQWRITY
jgi:translocation and assembly module TamB